MIRLKGIRLYQKGMTSNFQHENRYFAIKTTAGVKIMDIGCKCE